MQREEKIKDWVIETVNIPPSKPLIGQDLAHKTLNLSSCHLKATMIMMPYTECINGGLIIILLSKC